MKLGQSSRPLVIGHRGAPVLAPENTMASFEAAIAAGADAIELDVSVGLVIAHSEDEIPDPPLVLDDVLDLVRVLEVGVLVDLKLAGIEVDVAAAVRRHNLLDHALVSTTSAAALRRLEQAEPALRRSISYPNDRFRVSRFTWPTLVSASVAGVARTAMPARVPLLLRSAHAGVLTLHQGVVSAAVVEAARRRGALVIAWTVNDPDGIERLAGLGVAGIVTDDPQLACAVLDRLNLQ